MHRTKLNQAGSGVVVLVLLLLVIGLVGVVGYRVVHNGPVPTTAASSVAVPSVAAPKVINNKSDLQRASNALDNTPIDRGVDGNQFDTDIKALL